jgi:ADP-ribosyl-[dinitrogen reductase] hydrolase
MVNEDQLIDRARGVIVGLACGDALGAPVEFESRETIEDRYPNGLRDFTSGGWMDVEPGELTDDSLTMLALAESLARPGPADPDDFGQRLVAWAAGDPKDIGNTTRLAIDYLGQGLPWHEAGARALAERGPEQAASNGSLMRCAPVAIRYRKQPELLREISLASSRVTHAEERAAWSTVAYNQAIAFYLNGGECEGMVAAAVAGIEQPDVVAAIAAAPQMSPAELNGRGFVLNGLQIAFRAVANHTALESAVVEAVMLGDDTDTNAAITGALAGARWGYSAIPERWRTGVQEHDRLVELADQLLSVEG